MKKPPELTESIKITKIAHRAVLLEQARRLKANLPRRTIQDLASEAILKTYKPD